MNAASKSRRKDLGRYLLLAACVVIYSLPFLRVLTLHADEGSCLTDAARVYHGQLPFRDFFEIIGPFTFYWMALFFQMFGETWLATRACALVIGTATALLLYHLASRLKPGSEIVTLIFWFAIVFPIWPSIEHHLLSNLFALAAFAMLLWWLAGGSRWIPFICGVSVGLTLCTMFPKGVLLFGALIAILLLRRATGIFQLFGGAAAVVLVCAGYFWARGALPDLYYQTLVWPARHYGELNAVPYGFGLGGYFWRTFGGFASAVHSVMEFSLASVLWIPPVVVFLLPVILPALSLILRRSALSEETIPYWLVGSALWISEIHRPDMVHLVLASPVFIVLLFSFMCQMRLPFLRRILMTSGAMLMSLNVLLCLVAPARVVTPVGSIRAFVRNPAIDFANAHIRPGESIFVYPYSPIYYFLNRAVNPTRFSFLLYGYDTREQMLQAIASLEMDRTKYVIWDTTFETAFAPTVLPSYRPPPTAERIIEPYLRNRYSEIYRDGGVLFLERRQ
jgi:hypothetical protein